MFPRYARRAVRAWSSRFAASPLLEGIGGRFDGDFTGVAPYALDEDSAERLWEVSLGLVGRRA
jgi:hypothetical protein